MRKEGRAISAADDVHAVTALLTTFARLADEGSLDELTALFTADVEWHMAGATWSGRDEVVTGLGSMRELGHAGPQSGNLHLVTNIEVDLDGDRATSRSYFQLAATDPVQIRVVGRYRDELRRVDGRWLLARREVG